MNRRKLHISQWCLLGLAAVLTVGGLLTAVGSTWARYRAETKETLLFSAREPKGIYLGQVRLAEDDKTRLFDDQAQGTWESVNGKAQLDFAVANGTLPSDVAEEDQQFRIRLVGSPGIWEGAQTAEIQLMVPKKTDASQYDTYEAAVTKIEPQSPMYDQFGDGWVFTFHDKLGDELTWNLVGGRFSCYEMRLVLENEMLTEASLLQLQVIG
ncbi:MAG: hypothetical protein E7444_04215 [Ruminococcaceae bacterium]|nr:hypothetical protein [Oscillospiraceae bacterium]